MRWLDPVVLCDGLLQVRAPALCFYVLRDAKGLYVMDGGFIGGLDLLRRMLCRVGWNSERILGVIVTHGHLDHLLNVSRIAAASGAWIAAPRLDMLHYSGRARYHGWARITGCLESIGRPVLKFRPFTPDRLLDNGDWIDVWQGLRAIHLPGHTAGHMGFHCERLNLLFSADLFSSYRGSAQLPPIIFNSRPPDVRMSVQRAASLALEGMIPNHCDRSSPAEHLRRFRILAAGLDGGFKSGRTGDQPRARSW